MKKIYAKFNSKCAETGKTIRKGDLMFYDYSTKKCYSMDSKEATKQQDTNSEADSTSSYVQAQEDAYWDRATGGYYSR